MKNYVPYFLEYKTDFFSFQNNPKDLDPSYKTDLELWDWIGLLFYVHGKHLRSCGDGLELWDCFGRVKLVL